MADNRENEPLWGDCGEGDSSLRREQVFVPGLERSGLFKGLTWNASAPYSPGQLQPASDFSSYLASSEPTSLEVMLACTPKLSCFMALSTVQVIGWCPSGW